MIEIYSFDFFIGHNQDDFTIPSLSLSLSLSLYLSLSLFYF